MVAVKHQGDGGLFLSFFFALREQGVLASPGQWLALLDAMSKHVHGHRKVGFYDVARCVLVSREKELLGFDRAFVHCFGSGAMPDIEQIHKDLLAWLQNPKRPNLDPELIKRLRSMDPDELRRAFAQRLREQKERHDGGSRWVGTGGISPFGHGGMHPSGLRVGGPGGGRQAMAVLDPRRYQAFDSTRTLDTRQMTSALRRLRKLGAVGQKTELDLPGSIDATAKMAGELEIRWRAPRKNTRRLLLLLDVGGSMDPHAERVSQLFSAVHRGGGFKRMRSYYFHNCVYDRVYRDAHFEQGIAVDDLLQELDQDWVFVLVGDACMHPAELSMASTDFWNPRPGPSGLERLAMMAQRWPRCAWINPENPRFWHHVTIRQIGDLFPMYQLSLDGLSQMVESLSRTARHGERERRARVDAMAKRGRSRL